MQILELQTGGHKVQSMRWNNQIIYRQRLPFDTYIYQGRANRNPPFDFPVTPYLDFSGLNPENKESDSNVEFMYRNRYKYSTDYDMGFAKGELQLQKVSSLSGYVGSHLPYFKISLPPMESLKVTMDMESYGNYPTNASSWQTYLFYSEKLVAASNLTKLIKYDGYVSANTDCYVRDFENSGSLYQEYLNNNIIIPFYNYVTISNPTDEKKDFYFYFCVNGHGNDPSADYHYYKNFGLGKITLERMVA